MKQTLIKWAVGLGLIAALVAEARAEKILELSASNTVSFNDEFNDETVSKAMVELQQIDETLPEGEEITLVLYTPGGSVSSGSLMFDFIKGLKHKVNTLTIFAASMGFHTAQNLNTRYILPSGTLMSHEGMTGVQGTAPGQVSSRLAFSLSMFDRLEKIAIARSGKISKEKYKELNNSEIWMGAERAIELGFADEVVVARCDSSLSGTKIQTFKVFVFTIEAVFSKCPLITGPLEMRMAGAGSPEEKTKAENEWLKARSWNKGVVKE